METETKSKSIESASMEIATGIQHRANEWLLGQIAGAITASYEKGRADERARLAAQTAAPPDPDDYLPGTNTSLAAACAAILRVRDAATEAHGDIGEPRYRQAAAALDLATSLLRAQ